MKTTSDYSKFRFFEWNRAINPVNLKQKKESIMRVGYIGGNPIICSLDVFKKTGLYYVIDGQHRITALMQLKMEVPFELIAGNPVELVKELNASQKAWQLKDYLAMWVKQGKENYIKLQNFIDEYGFKTVVGINVAWGDKNDRNYTKQIKLGGDFSFSPLKDEVAIFLKTSGVPYWETTAYIRAINEMFRRLSGDKKQLIYKKVKPKLLTIPQMANTSQYLKAFENLINYHSKDKITL